MMAAAGVESRLRALALLLLASSGCSAAASATPIERIEIACQAPEQETSWRLTRATASVPEAGCSTRFWLRVRTPAIDAPDPAVRIGKLLDVEEARVDGVPLSPTGTLHLIPVPATPASLVVRVRSYHVPSFTVGSQRALWVSALRRELPPLAVAGTLTVAGLLLVLATLRRDAARAYRGLGLFLGSLGLITATGLLLLRSVLLSSGVMLLVHEGASLLYPVGFADFAVSVLGEGRRRVLSRGLRLYGVYAVAAVVLFALRPEQLGLIHAPINVFVVVFALHALARAVQLSRAGDRAARAFLAGIGALLMVALPDLVDGMDLITLEFQTTPYGVLAFGVVMAVVIERRLADTRDDLARKVAALDAQSREVGALNAELRHQIAERSRQLAEALRTGLTLPSKAPSLREGDVVDGRYRVGRTLGQGGMGMVFEAERLGDGRRLALKVMSGVASPTDAVRFAREAEIAARLADPRLVSVVDVGTGGHGLLYLVMELVEGRALSAARDRFGDVAWGAGILRQIAAALVTLHRAGVVHRDLKPANVLLARVGDDEVAKISDFGISRFGASEDAEVSEPRAAELAETLPTRPTLGELWPATGGLAPAAAGPAPALTQTGALMGTPAYMAPELAHGARRARPASDIFAFGLIAHEVLAGRPAFPAPPVMLAARGVLPPEDPLPPSVGPALAAIVARCLDPAPERRPSAEEVLAALAAAEG